MIVDPQVDFIAGTLPVPGAEEAMNGLAAYVAENGGRYRHKIVTADWHPYFHMSFAQCGGEWPRHCVRNTVGAAIWQPLVDALYQTAGDVTVLYKGEKADVEEYSIFKNARAASAIDEIIKKFGIGKIDLCGLAGDVCVSGTLLDGIDRCGKQIWNVLREYAPSLDGGGRLGAICAGLPK